jgi:putative ABC transport system substrate-binding protein
MRRREFIGFLGGVVTIVCLRASRAQQKKVARIGVLVFGVPDPEQFLRGLREGLEKVGYIEGQNIRLDMRSAAGKASLLPEAAAELLRLKVDIIVPWQSLATQAAKQATNEIPIVMVGVFDPIVAGVIADLARPDGNITGTAGLATERGGKLFELIREVLPSANRVAVLTLAESAFAKPFLAHVELAARAVDIEIQPIMLRPEEEFDAAFTEMRRKRTDAVILLPNVVRKEAIDLALKHKIPSFSLARQLPANGGLMSYSSNPTELFDLTARYIDKILKGSKPADLPVVRSSKFTLIINLKTAKALGVTVPPSLLARADEVIE